MKIQELISAPRYGVYDPKKKTVVAFEYTGYGKSGFKISATLELGDDETFAKVEGILKNYLDKSKQYLNSNDLGLVSTLLDTTANGLQYAVKFDKNGITLASLITVNARKVNIIYEKYSASEYELQLALTKKSSIKFAFSDSALIGDFYFNLKRTEKEDITTITGYTDFHLGNNDAAKPVILSAGIIERAPITLQTEAATTAQKTQKVKYIYIQLRSRNSVGLTIADIVRMVTPESVAIPEALSKVVIYDFAILKTNQEKDSSLAIILDCHIEINDKLLKTKLTIVAETKGGKKSFHFLGKVMLDQHRFDINFKKEEAHWAILAQYDSGKSSAEINFRKLAVALFGDGIKEQVPDLKLNIENFKAFFYYKQKEKQHNLLLGLGAGINLNLDQLPIAGGILAEANAIAFKEVLVMYAAGTFTEKELKSINALPKGYKQKTGLSISAEVVIDGTSSYYTLGGKTEPAEMQKSPTPKVGETTEVKNAASDNEKTDTSKSISDAVATAVSWSKIDKKIGAVNLQRLGLAYDKGKIIALLDASIETNTLGMQLLGLGIGINLDWNNLDTEFYLDGLGLSYKTDTVEIAGALMRTTANGVEMYNGQARIKLKSFTLSAIGSYAQVNGERSLFIYGLYQGNIGGPPIFHVTAIAAGFGYNRKVNAPDVSEVATFPLVALAMQPEGKSLSDVLTSLETEMSNGKKAIEMASGNHWLAVGVKFTSFKIIESFLLLTANFSPKTEFTVLGLSRLSWPEKSLREKLQLADPIVFVELAIKASFSPDSDVIKIDGLISPNSYILSKDCKLSGGFAFYTWVSGAHAGDFVMTIGGYHPRFPKPAHYPTVPRVALNWKLDDNLQIKGELYFALTPSAIMMGGRWELLYNSGNVRAAFIMWIDILMQWAPFYYDISLGIILRVETNIKLLFVTVQVNLEIRAQLTIWGPPFSGRAEIDLGIFSFEIGFGSKEQPKKEPLQWHQFAEGFLPQAEQKPLLKSQKNNLRPIGATPNVKIDSITISVTNGVIDCLEQEGGKKLHIANPSQVQFAVDSTIPVTHFTINNSAPDISDKSVTNSNVGVRPCGMSLGKVDFDMDVSVKLGGQYVTNFNFIKITKGFPEALWGLPVASESKEPKAPTVIDNVLSGLQISAKPISEPEATQKFDFSKYVEKETTIKDVSFYELQSAEAFHTREVYPNMSDYKTSAPVRDEIISALTSLGFYEADFYDFKDVETVYADPAAYFRGTPKLGSIGHEVFNPTDTK